MTGPNQDSLSVYIRVGQNSGFFITGLNLALFGFLKRCSLEAASSPWRILIRVEGAKNCPDGAPRENIGIKQAGARGGRIIASPPWREVHVQGVLSHNSAILWSTWLP